MDTMVKFEFDSGVSHIDLKQWILNRNVSDTNILARKFIKPCNNKYEVCCMIAIVCKAFRENDIVERPYKFTSNKTVAKNFWRRIEILEDVIKKLEEQTIDDDYEQI